MCSRPPPPFVHNEFPFFWDVGLLTLSPKSLVDRVWSGQLMILKININLYTGTFWTIYFTLTLDTLQLQKKKIIDFIINTTKIVLCIHWRQKGVGGGWGKRSVIQTHWLIFQSSVFANLFHQSYTNNKLLTITAVVLNSVMMEYHMEAKFSMKEWISFAPWAHSMWRNRCQLIILQELHWKLGCCVINNCRHTCLHCT